MASAHCPRRAPIMPNASTALLFVDQDVLLPPAWRFVRTVDASRPTTGPLFPLMQLLNGSVNAALARFWLLCIFDPANKFISPQWRKRLPQRPCILVRPDRRLHIRVGAVHGSVRKTIGHGCNLSGLGVVSNPKMSTCAPDGRDGAITIAGSAGDEQGRHAKSVAIRRSGRTGPRRAAPPTTTRDKRRILAYARAPS